MDYKVVVCNRTMGDRNCCKYRGKKRCVFPFIITCPHLTPFPIGNINLNLCSYTWRLAPLEHLQRVLSSPVSTSRDLSLIHI